jgi:hypothetical protein
MRHFLVMIRKFLALGATALVFTFCTSLPPDSADTVMAPFTLPLIPETRPADTVDVLPSTAVTDEEPVAYKFTGSIIPELPEHPEPPEHIMGSGMVPREKLAAFLLFHNIFVDDDFVHLLSGYYIEEASVEGVNYDTAFAQMCLETGFLSYGGLVTPDMNNFCGLGAIGPAEPGLVFPDPRTGVRAHIQHLKAYATVDPLNLSLVDPRYYLVRHGSSPTIHGLSGTWAADRAYSEKINRILQRLYDFSF